MEKDILICKPLTGRPAHAGATAHTALWTSDSRALWLSYQTVQEVCAKKKCCKRFKKNGKKKCKNCPKRK